MRLWVLTRRKAGNRGEMAAVLIRADTEFDARQFANLSCGFESQIWDDPGEVKAWPLEPDGKPGVIFSRDIR
jgi:hypothetical protein